MNYFLLKEFRVYIDNHALSFLDEHKKLNQRHLKWLELLQSYTCTIKHKKSLINKVAHTLRKSPHHTRNVVAKYKVECY